MLTEILVIKLKQQELEKKLDCVFIRIITDEKNSTFSDK